MSTTRCKSNKYKATAASLAKWGGARKKAVVALRAGWSIGAIARAYTKTMATFKITRIDIGPCLLAGHTGERIRIHFGAVEASARLPLGAADNLCAARLIYK